MTLARKSLLALNLGGEVFPLSKFLGWTQHMRSEFASHDT